jgi:hypothetical protein
MGQDTPATALGYPDMDAGTYSRLFAYKDWFEFDCAMRMHQNNDEHLAWTLPTFMMSGVFFPWATAALGFTVNETLSFNGGDVSKLQEAMPLLEVPNYKRKEIK